MQKQLIRKRFITLIEIMIVMFLIALITGVIAYNYRGSLEEGKAFKTRTAMEKIETILNLAIAEDPNKADHIESEWAEIIRRSPLVQNVDALTKDGWGDPFQVTYSRETNGIVVHSRKYDEYLRTHQTMFRK